MIPTARIHPVARRFGIAVMLLVLPGIVQAAATLVSDRNPVRVNESFTLTIQLDGQDDGEPDLSPLAGLLDVLGTSQETRTSVINRRVQSLTSWHISVMAKQSGTLKIPRIKVGRERTNPLEISVRPADTGPRSQQDIYLEVEAQPHQPYVQQQVIYTVRLVSAVVTADERLSQPKLLKGEAVIEQLGDRKIYTVQRDNRTLRVIESSYAIFPQQSGPLKLDKIQALVRVFDASTGQQWSLLSARPSEFRLTGDALSLQVQPVPASYPPSPWLPATSVKLKESITDSPYIVGEPLTRTVRLMAQGLTSGQLPEIRLPAPGGLKAYPDRPALSDQVADGKLNASREQRIAYIPQTAGTITLPALRIPWWNTTSNQLQYAELPARVFSVQPSPPSAQDATNPVIGKTQAIPGAQSSPIWKLTTIAALAAWLIPLLIWWRGRVRQAKHAKRTGKQYSSSLQAGQRALQSACMAGDKERAKAGLTAYLQLRFPDLNAAQAQQRLEALVPGIGEEIDVLSRALYGPTPGPTNWRGDKLWALLNDHIKQQPAGRSAQGMTVLYPGPQSET